MLYGIPARSSSSDNSRPAKPAPTITTLGFVVLIGREMVCRFEKRDVGLMRTEMVPNEG